MNVEVTFRFPTMTVTTTVNVGNLEYEPNIRAKAISMASCHLMREYRLTTQFLNYRTDVTTDIDVLV